MISSFNEYQKEAMKTAVYPNIGSNLAYPVLGLIDEIGEYMSAPDDDMYAELSDVCWYCAACYFESGIEYDGHSLWRPLDNIYPTLSSMAGVAKKAMRDNGGMIQPSRVGEFYQFLRWVSGWIHAECVMLGINPLELMQYNLNKLADRQSRNVIKGDGDYR